MDKKFINIAINLAKKNLGLTAPNPVVGCVIVKNGEIISSGVTAVGGQPHGESVAIDKITDKTRLEGATIYVSLEPCSHFGKTSPCVDLIISHKIKKVVIATIDTCKKVDGQGIAKLREAGVEVVCGILEKEAREINKAFFKKEETGLPYVTLKLATSLDGKIATKNLQSKWISGERARKFAHYLRAQNDAIMVGSNTVKKDNPALDCRLVGLENYSPKKIIVANIIDFDLNLKLFQNDTIASTIILTGESSAKKYHQNIEALKNLGVEFVFCAENKNSPSINLEFALRKIADSGVNSILLEGGKNLATQFLQQNLVDELVWIQNKKIIGEDGISAIGEMGFLTIDEALQSFERVETRELDENDFASIYRRF